MRPCYYWFRDASKIVKKQKSGSSTVLYVCVDCSYVILRNNFITFFLLIFADFSVVKCFLICDFLIVCFVRVYYIYFWQNRLLVRFIYLEIIIDVIFEKVNKSFALKFNVLLYFSIHLFR